ncbi:MAG: methyltransferase domain-containing protein [Armatimonadetes bacterium]|nr:methyltransferase domain-containing protein [Armatimonadota bacterium]
MNLNPQAIEADIAVRFEALAVNPAQEYRFSVGRESALALGYSPEELDALPDEAIEAFAGVGYPFAIGCPRPGEAVLDIGCGAGMDALLAARWCAPGRVIGIDMVPAMVARAGRAAANAGLDNAQFRLGRADSVPVQDAEADLVLTNGVLNLCVDKPRVAAECYRALRSGGRLQMADILLESHVTPEEVADRGAWSD